MGLSRCHRRRADADLGPVLIKTSDDPATCRIIQQDGVNDDVGLIVSISATISRPDTEGTFSESIGADHVRHCLRDSGLARPKSCHLPDLE